MLGFQKKNKALQPLYATQNGSAVPLCEVPDQIFAEKILGDGFCILPTDGLVVSPAAGTVITIADAKHAYNIETDDGLELVVHIGINTVTLGGAGFEPLVEPGQHVTAGTPIARVDLDLILARNLTLYTSTLITNCSEVGLDCRVAGATIAGKTQMLQYKFLP